MSPRPVTIVSGGQTGVDRGALDAALELGAPCGGWCPEGRRAEDGAIPDRYPLRVLTGAGYAERTCRNVADSDGTLIIAFGDQCPGTELTIRHARKLGRPLLQIDAETADPGAALPRVLEFIRQHRIATLNVAGPRASVAPGAHAFAGTLIGDVLRS